MKSAEVFVNYSLDVVCPYCEADIDLCEQDDDSYFSSGIFSNHWEDLIGLEAHCPDCSRDFIISKVEC